MLQRRVQSDCKLAAAYLSRISWRYSSVVGLVLGSSNLCIKAAEVLPLNFSAISDHNADVLMTRITQQHITLLDIPPL